MNNTTPIQSTSLAESTALVIKPTKKRHRFKKTKNRRLQQKRLKEFIYLNHFLAINGIRPDRIISGKDDGKEPDFTIIINKRLIGIELTTLPRLRERMSTDYLIWRKWYWSIRKLLSIGHTKQYDPHHLHLCSQTFNHSITNKPQPSSKSKQAIPSPTNLNSNTDTNTNTDTSYKIDIPDTDNLNFDNPYCYNSNGSIQSNPSNLNYPTQYFQSKNLSSHQTSFFKTLRKSIKKSIKQLIKLAKQVEKTIPPSQSYFINPKQIDSVRQVSDTYGSKNHTIKESNNQGNTYTTHPTLLASQKPISHILQSDIDAVMQKKAHKTDTYKTRRPLDELWLLVHCNHEHPNINLFMPTQHLHHDSDFDQVCLTIYPKQQTYAIKRKKA